jgi:hypothetical protein
MTVQELINELMQIENRDVKVVGIRNFDDEYSDYIDFSEVSELIDFKTKQAKFVTIM